MKIARALSVREGNGEVSRWASCCREVTCCRGNRAAWLSGAEKSRQIRQPDGWGVMVCEWPLSFGFVACIADRSGLDA